MVFSACWKNIPRGERVKGLISVVSLFTAFDFSNVMKSWKIDLIELGSQHCGTAQRFRPQIKF